MSENYKLTIMKELSIEEKVKAYDEIIKKANKIHSENCEACQICIEELIPEFREESEDERIRKWIIGVLSTYEHDRDLRDAAIAWLERQCSQILANSAKTCKVEQKPTEEYNITGIKSKHAQGKLGEMIKKLKPVNEVLEQKHWSEEDGSRMDNLCHFLEEYGNQYYGHLTLQGTISWLKSLRPQNRWKPSEEQMITLRHVISGCSYDIEPLVELETKLKEL